VLPGNIVPWVGDGLGLGDSNDAKCRMVRRVRQLSLERFEPVPQDVGLGKAKLSGHSLEPASLQPVQIDLNRLAHAIISIMILCHEIMILIHDKRVNTSAQPKKGTCRPLNLPCTVPIFPVRGVRE